ncbi:MAG: ATP-binding protein [Lachnospiraceae bacterium]|nr:ATP-binding protein [Lachnospiraceae bacterium]
MYRNIINELATWYEEPRKRILYIKGALGVGKTWTVTDFATGFFEGYKLIDLSVDTAFKSILSSDSDIDTIISNLDFMLEQHFGEIDYTKQLLIFDEVQDVQDIDRFFYEYAKRHRNYVICLIASSMKITEFEYHHKDVFNIIRMRPMTFDEFLIANKATPLISAIENSKTTPLSSVEEDTAKSMLRDFLIVGGMPGIVKHFIKNKDFQAVRQMQLDLLDTYNKLIKSSFSASMSQRCRRIWKSIPSQLSRDNKKFMYRFVEDNARSREYSDATYNLCSLGLSRKLPRLTANTPPLEDHVDYKSFELFMIDHGLLRAQFGFPAEDTLTLETIFAEANGAVAEQYIFQELSNKVGFLYYWISKATARVPFVYEGESTAVPVDIRFTANKKAQNIKTFKLQNPNTDISVQISLHPVSFTEGILNIPAYGLWNM